MLGSLHVRSVKLMTNNPEKIRDLQSHGVKITGRIPLITEPNEYNQCYRETKKLKAGHVLDKSVPEVSLEHRNEINDHNHSARTRNDGDASSSDWMASDAVCA